MITDKEDIPKTGRERLIYIGMLRICSDCKFESSDRTEFRKHLRDYNHTKKMKGRFDNK